MRPVRREKLNRAANSGENPGFDFLQECWNDDPAKADCDQEIAGEVSVLGVGGGGWWAGEVGGVAIAYHTAPAYTTRKPIWKPRWRLQLPRR